MPAAGQPYLQVSVMPGARLMASQTAPRPGLLTNGEVFPIMTDVFAAVFAALYAAHQVGDHWVQTDTQARTKSQPGWAGRRACAAHVTTYTATALAGLLAVAGVTGAVFSPVAVTAGLAVSAASHYAADRRAPLARLAAWVPGKASFWSLGAPRPGRDDNPSLGTGAYALDQSWHVGWLFVAALIIAGGGA